MAIKAHAGLENPDVGLNHMRTFTNVIVHSSKCYNN